MLKLLSSIKEFVLVHNNVIKRIMIRIIFLGLIVGGYLLYNNLTGTAGGATRYIMAIAQKQTVTDSVSGTGQVTASNQIDLTAKVSGTIISLPTAEGNIVGVGQIIAQLDSTIAQKAVRDARANLENAKLSHEKLKRSADTLSVLQAENSLEQTKESKLKAEDDLKKAYEDGFNTVANTFLDLPTVMAGLQDILFSSTLESNQQNSDYYASTARIFDEKALQYKNDSYNTYQVARKDYNQNFTDYKLSSRFSSKTIIEKIIDQTYDTTKNIAEAVKSANNLVQFYQDKLTEKNIKPNPLSDTHLLSLNTYTGKTNTHLLNLLAIKRTIQTSRETITNAERAIAEKTEALTKLKAGAIPLDIQSSELSVKQRENALFDAEQLFADYTIRAPFKGTLGKIDVKKFSNVNGGAVIGTLITTQLTARVVLNEVVAAKVKVGHKATLTFDALDGLSLTGVVAQIDTIGTISQGVVSYAVKIIFDTQDNRVKLGMSTSAVIVTQIRPDVLTVPNSAVKTRGGTQYVQIFDTPITNTTGNKEVLSSTPPREQQVKVGLSDDTNTEIISGIKEGDQVVVQTISADAALPEKTSQAPSIIPAGGNGP